MNHKIPFVRLFCGERSNQRLAFGMETSPALDLADDEYCIVWKHHFDFV